MFRSPRVESRDHEYSESITMYRGEDSGPEFSEEEPEYTDIKVEVSLANKNSTSRSLISKLDI